MFMKHYAPNRCLYRKVAKLRTGVGSAISSHPVGGGSGGGRGGQDGCERRIKVFVKLQKILFFLGGGSGRGGGSGGVRVDVNEELKFLGKFTKQNRGGGGQVGGVKLVGGQGGCERNEGGRG